MRLYLKDGGRQHFTGVIGTYGSDHEGKGVTGLIDLEDQEGYLATNHLWLQYSLIPLSGNQKKSLNQIVSFVATPQKYVKHSSHEENFGLSGLGRVFYAVSLPRDLNSVVIDKMKTNPNKYFAGIIQNHQLTFIGHNQNGEISNTATNIAYFRTIRALITAINPVFDRQPTYIFKVIRYKNITYFGLPSHR